MNKHELIFLSAPNSPEVDQNDENLEETLLPGRYTDRIKELGSTSLIFSDVSGVGFEKRDDIEEAETKSEKPIHSYKTWKNRKTKDRAKARNKKRY